MTTDLDLEQLSAALSAVLDAREDVDRVMVALANQIDDAVTSARGRLRESEGYRLVDGGQTGLTDDDEFVWEYTDYRTGEVLATGVGDLGDAWGDKWFHVDCLDDDNEDPR